MKGGKVILHSFANGCSFIVYFSLLVLEIKGISAFQIAHIIILPVVIVLETFLGGHEYFIILTNNCHLFVLGNFNSILANVSADIQSP